MQVRDLAADCPVTISVQSPDLLNINVTDALLDTLGGVSRTWALAQKLRASQSNRLVARMADTRDEFSLHRIRNDTGVEIVYSVRGGVRRVLKPGEEAPLHLLPRQIDEDEELLPAGRVMEAMQRSSLTLALDVPGETWEPLEGVRVEQVGVRLYELREGDTMLGQRSHASTASLESQYQPGRRSVTATDPPPGPSPSPEVMARGGRLRVVCESTITQGSIMLRVRSTVVVKNFMSVPVEVEACNAQGEPVWTTELAPHRSAPVPVHLVDVADKFRLCPVLTSRHTRERIRCVVHGDGVVLAVVKRVAPPLCIHTFAPSCPQCELSRRRCCRLREDGAQVLQARRPRFAAIVHGPQDTHGRGRRRRNCAAVTGRPPPANVC